MEFLKQNQYNTTTSIVPPSGSDVADALFDRSTTKYWETVGATGASVVLSIEFASPRVISHLLIQSHNMKRFRVFYDSATANTFPTNVNVTTNSDTSSYFDLGSTTVSSLQIQMDSTTVAGVEYRIGELIATERLAVFERNPSADDYKPVRSKKRIVHEMPDGGVKVFEVSQKFRAEMRWGFITQTFHDSLLSVFELAEPFTFAPFPTTSAWDGFAKQVIWDGDFDFAHDTNDKAQGFGGKVRIREVAAG
jgi:hypothetical protein